MFCLRQGRMEWNIAIGILLIVTEGIILDKIERSDITNYNTMFRSQISNF